jgi:hypothetical protein
MQTLHFSIHTLHQAQRSVTEVASSQKSYYGHISYHINIITTVNMLSYLSQLQHFSGDASLARYSRTKVITTGRRFKKYKSGVATSDTINMGN